LIFCSWIASCSDEILNSNPAQGLKAERAAFNPDLDLIEDSIKANLAETTTADTENVILADNAYVVFKVVALDDLGRGNLESQITFHRTMLLGRAFLKIQSTVCEISDRNIFINDFRIQPYLGEFWDLESKVLWVALEKTTVDDAMRDQCKN